MLIVMAPDADEQAISAVVARARELGLAARRCGRDERRAVAGSSSRLMRASALPRPNSKPLISAARPAEVRAWSSTWALPRKMKE